MPGHFRKRQETEDQNDDKLRSRRETPNTLHCRNLQNKNQSKCCGKGLTCRSNQKWNEHYGPKPKTSSSLAEYNAPLSIYIFRTLNTCPQQELHAGRPATQTGSHRLCKYKIKEQLLCSLLFLQLNFGGSFHRNTSDFLCCKSIAKETHDRNTTREQSGAQPIEISTDGIR